LIQRKARRHLSTVALVLIALAVVAPGVWLTAALVRGLDASISSRRYERLAIERNELTFSLLDRLGEYQLATIPRPRAAAAFERDLGAYEQTLADMRHERSEDDVRSVRAIWNQERRDPQGAAFETGHRLLHFSDVIAEYYSLGFADADRRGDIATLFMSDLPGAQEELVRASRVTIESPDGVLSPERRVEIAGRLSAHFFHRNSGRLNLATTERKFGTAAAQLGVETTAALAHMAALDRRLERYTHGRALTARDRGEIRSSMQAIVADVRRAQAEAEALVNSDLQAEIAGFELRRAEYLAFSGLGALISLGILYAIWCSLRGRHRRELDTITGEKSVLEAELARRKAEQARMLTEAQFRTVFENAQLGIVIFDETGAVRDASPSLRRMIGDRVGEVVPTDSEHFADLIAGKRPSYRFETEVARPNGAMMAADVTVSLVGGEEGRTIAMAIVEDVTEEKQTRRRLEYEATHDGLTGLPNRLAFIAELDAVIAESRRTGATDYVVLFIDVNHFKSINDSYGHQAGDSVLQQTAKRLIASVRPGDIVARLHGDEFAVLVRRVTASSDARAVANRVQRDICNTITVDRIAISVSTSLGMAMASLHYRRGEELIRDADTAMYEAKTGATTEPVLFDESMHERARHKIRLLSDIRRAVDAGEFRVVYQPIVSLEDGGLVGFEALLRWSHPVLGEIPPDRFIPLAEESKTIFDLGRFVMEEAVLQLSRWDATLHGYAPFSMSINVSALQIANGSASRDLDRILRSLGVPSHQIALEITESLLLGRDKGAATTLSEVREIGSRLCIDDFGIGYSSLRYLNEFPIDTLKLDRSFVSAADGGIANEAIVKMILNLADSLNLAVVGEGVETDQQRIALSHLGCTYGQGWLYSKPLPAAELGPMINQRLATGKKVAARDPRTRAVIGAHVPWNIPAEELARVVISPDFERDIILRRARLAG
jgi:diguanylate cyclase (GGDEF)-like protein/PAS domain S-box-containing protein